MQTSRGQFLMGALAAPGIALAQKAAVPLIDRRFGRHHCCCRRPAVASNGVTDGPTGHQTR
jgi:hypothetical protein